MKCLLALLFPSIDEKEEEDRTMTERNKRRLVVEVVILAVLLILVASTIALAQEEGFWRVGNEVSLVNLKANPEDYVGKAFIICGGIQLDDSYRSAYWNSEDSHYSLYFREAGKKYPSLSHRSAYLYLSKKVGRPIVDALVRFEEPDKDVVKAVRAMVILRSDVYADDKRWDVLELVDVQFRDKKKWGPWMLRELKKKESLRQQRIQAQAARRAAEAKAKREQAIRAAKRRTWTSGSHTVEAEFVKMLRGIVHLKRLDNEKVITIPMDKLSKEDQSFIKHRGWLRMKKR